MPVGYAEARNMVFHKSAVRGRLLFTEKKGTMKAIRIHNYGGPEVLQYKDAPRPKPQERELLTTRALFFLAAAAFMNALNLSRFQPFLTLS